MADARSTRHSFVSQAQSQDGSKQSLGITTDGQVYSWGPKHSLGQLGRTVSKTHPRNKPAKVDFDKSDSTPHAAARVYAGGFADAGHSAVLDREGQLWMAGCDRWQQLGFGSPSGGAGGYTWLKSGRIYHFQFLRNEFVLPLLQQYDSSAAIRDVALGGDHSVILSSNKRDVVTFGKGGERQLGLSQKLFLSAPAKSSELSSSRPEIAAVCAIENCSLTLNDEGSVLKQAGKCRETTQFMKALGACQQRAADSGLLTDSGLLSASRKKSTSETLNQ
eukprot:scaffold5952_cov154-Amphora_coffeaeformis.AAC.2